MRILSLVAQSSQEDMAIIGFNIVAHLCAGTPEPQGIGDDTSGTKPVVNPLCGSIHSRPAASLVPDILSVLSKGIKRPIVTLWIGMIAPFRDVR